MERLTKYDGRGGVGWFRPLTMDECKALKVGHHIWMKCKGGDARRVKINGKPRLWKRTPDRIEVPWKYGLYSYGYFTAPEIDAGDVLIEVFPAEAATPTPVQIPAITVPVMVIEGSLDKIVEALSDNLLTKLPPPLPHPQKDPVTPFAEIAGYAAHGSRWYKIEKIDGPHVFLGEEMPIDFKPPQYDMVVCRSDRYRAEAMGIGVIRVWPHEEKTVRVVTLGVDPMPVDERALRELQQAHNAMPAAEFRYDGREWNVEIDAGAMRCTGYTNRDKIIESLHKCGYHRLQIATIVGFAETRLT